MKQFNYRPSIQFQVPLNCFNALHHLKLFNEFQDNDNSNKFVTKNGKWQSSSSKKYEQIVSFALG